MCQHSNSPLSWSVVTAAVRPTPEEPRPVVAMARGAVFSTYLTHCHNENTSDPLPCVAYKHQTHCHNETYQTHCHVYTHISDTLLKRSTSNPLPRVAHKCIAARKHIKPTAMRIHMYYQTHCRVSLQLFSLTETVSFLLILLRNRNPLYTP